MTIPDNTQDVIDSRDIIDRIAELVTEIEEAAEPEFADVAELATLQRLADEASDYAEDWTDGVTLVRDSYFVTYAQELAEELGYLNAPRADSWPYTCIDWEKAARELQMDYTAVTFDGITYWVR